MFPAQLHPLLSFSALGGSLNSTFDPTADLKRQYANKVSMQNKNKSKYKKPSGKPKRPLSAYNIFFKQEREKLVKDGKKVGFANMAKLISKLWKSLDEEGRKEFVAAAEIEQKRYRAAVKEWKQQSKAEAEMAYNSCHSSSSSVSSSQSSMAPMPPQNNQQLALQRMMLQQQMMEQQHMMRQQMEMQFGGPRRMSMPMAPTSAPQVSNSNAAVQQQPVPQNGRRFSMPLHPGGPVTVTSAPTTVDMTQETLTQSTTDSADDSSLDDLTADFLINMPIMDLQDKGLPSSVVMPLPQPSRRSSMPTMPTTKRPEWNVNPTPLAPGSRRLSMPTLNDEVTEMEDILAMLDDDGPMFPSSTAA